MHIRRLYPAKRFSSGAAGLVVVLVTLLFRGAAAGEAESSCSPEWRCDKTAATAGRLRKATWVWNTARLLGDDREQQAMACFLADHGFDLVFLQLPGSGDDSEPDAGVGIDAQKLRPLLRLLKEKGIEVHALDGDKSYALPGAHRRVLKTVENVILYNRSVTEKERFSGIHYDIEPYLLPEFEGDGKERVLKSYLALLSALRQLTSGESLAFGVDIPFWYDSVVRRLDFQGACKPPTEHILDLVDNVGIMDYRTSASGRDGIVSHARETLSYAARVGKQVFVGLEVSPLHEAGVPSAKLTFHELGPRRLLEEMEKTADACAGFSSFAGFALHHYGSYLAFIDGARRR